MEWVELQEVKEMALGLTRVHTKEKQKALAKGREGANPVPRKRSNE